MNRRLTKIELDTNGLLSDRIKRLVDGDPDVRALLERWDELAYAYEGDVPPDYLPDLGELVHLRRQFPDIETRVLVEHIWRRERAREDDPALDRELTAIEERVNREVRSG